MVGKAKSSSAAALGTDKMDLLCSSRKQCIPDSLSSATLDLAAACGCQMPCWMAVWPAFFQQQKLCEACSGLGICSSFLASSTALFFCLCRSFCNASMTCQQKCTFFSSMMPWQAEAIPFGWLGWTGAFRCRHVHVQLIVHAARPPGCSHACISDQHT